MTTQEIVSKLWRLCDVLRDDGITYHQYVTELTYILFLKMAKETQIEKNFPKLSEEVTKADGTKEIIEITYSWDMMASKDGIELKKFYVGILNHLSENGVGRIREIYQGAITNIDEPKNLKKIITYIDTLDWYSAKEEGLGTKKMQVRKNLAQVNILLRVLSLMLLLN